MSVKISKRFATVSRCMVFPPAVLALQVAHEELERALGFSHTAKAGGAHGG